MTKFNPQNFPFQATLQISTPNYSIYSRKFLYASKVHILSYFLYTKSNSKVKKNYAKDSVYFYNDTLTALIKVSTTFSCCKT